jgi:hypothetical protein
MKADLAVAERLERAYRLALALEGLCQHEGAAPARRQRLAQRLLRLLDETRASMLVGAGDISVAAAAAAPGRRWPRR